MDRLIDLSIGFVCMFRSLSLSSNLFGYARRVDGGREGRRRLLYTDCPKVRSPTSDKCEWQFLIGKEGSGSYGWGRSTLD